MFKWDLQIFDIQNTNCQLSGLCSRRYRAPSRKTRSLCWVVVERLASVKCFRLFSVAIYFSFCDCICPLFFTFSWHAQCTSETSVHQNMQELQHKELLIIVITIKCIYWWLMRRNTLAAREPDVQITIIGWNIDSPRSALIPHEYLVIVKVGWNRN